MRQELYIKRENLEDLQIKTQLQAFNQDIKNVKTGLDNKLA